MRDKIIIGLVSLSAFIFGISLYVKIKNKPKLVEVDRSVTETGKWLVFNPDDLEAKPGVKTFNVYGAKQLDGMNAFTLDYDPSTQPQIMNVIPKGWVVQKEYVHHILMGANPVAQKCYRGEVVEVACEPLPNPNPTPDPTPTPTPTPTPEPIEPARSWGITRVRANEAKRLVDTSNVKVCVIDTGIDLNHPNNGQVIGSIGYAGAVQDRQGHGTHVAGTIAGTGGVGVSRAKLLVCKGLSDSGSGSSSQLAQCLTWCGSQGAQIVSNSWGSTQSDPLINQAIQNLTARGIYVFVANGNDGRAVNWPARLAGSNPLVYAVAASDQGDRITSFSSRGQETRYISPGAGIISNWPGGGTRSLDGTSMATPHAAGICAFGVAKRIKPCIKTTGTVSGYPFADALETAK